MKHWCVGHVAQVEEHVEQTIRIGRSPPDEVAARMSPSRAVSSPRPCLRQRRSRPKGASPKAGPMRGRHAAKFALVAGRADCGEAEQALPSRGAKRERAARSRRVADAAALGDHCEMRLWRAVGPRTLSSHLAPARILGRSASGKPSMGQSSGAAGKPGPTPSAAPPAGKAVAEAGPSTTPRTARRVNTGIMTQQAKGKRAQKKLRKEDGQRREGEADYSRRVSALLMGSVHRPSELAAKLRERFGAGAVRQLSTHEDSPIVHGDALLLLPAADTHAQGIVSDVLYLCVPGNEAREPPADAPGAPPPPAAWQSGSSVRVFFFTGSGSSRGEALGEAGGWGIGSAAGGGSFGLGGSLGG
eukprot:scaffold8462_cov110-Isochrysis_galbana.AAC.1